MNTAREESREQYLLLFYFIGERWLCLAQQNQRPRDAARTD
jgi:hypothetical protein